MTDPLSETNVFLTDAARCHRRRSEATVDHASINLKERSGWRFRVAFVERFVESESAVLLEGKRILRGGRFAVVVLFPLRQGIYNAKSRPGKSRGILLPYQSASCILTRSRLLMFAKRGYP